MEKKAILYVENFEGLSELAFFLINDGWSIYSSKKTAAFLKDIKIPFKIEKSLSDSSMSSPDSSLIMRQLLRTQLNETSDIPFTSVEQDNNVFLVCMNLKPSICEYSELKNVYENISPIFASSILRTASSNYKNILLLTDPADYNEAIIQIRTNSVSEEFRLYLAGKCLNMISAFDAANSYSILQGSSYSSSYQNYLMLPYEKISDLHYGANTHQTSALYELCELNQSGKGYKKLQGRELSHRIITDISFAWDQISLFHQNLKNQFSVNSVNRDGYPFTTQFTPLTGTVLTVTTKFKQITGAALDSSVTGSFLKTLSYDSDTIDHSCIGCSAVIDDNAAKEIVKHPFSAIIAPGFTDEARDILSENRSIRLIIAPVPSTHSKSLLYLENQILVQSADTTLFDKWIVPTKTRPSQYLIDELAFGTIIAMSASSYATVALKKNALVGIAGGFGSRQKSLENVLYEAKQTFKIHPTEDNTIADILVCDCAINLNDAVKELIDRGVTAILQTGGTPNDQELIDYCDSYNVAMIFTGFTHNNY